MDIQFTYPGIDGFLGTRASLMLDVVFLALFAILPTLGASIALVRYGRRYELHKWIQTTLGLVLLVTVALFEADMQLHGWRERAEASPYYRHADGSQGPLFSVLYVHLTFAVSTCLLWIVVIVRAWRNFPRPAAPGPHSRWHIFWARLAALGMLATGVTGWIFYWLAFAVTAAGSG